MSTSRWPSRYIHRPVRVVPSSIACPAYPIVPESRPVSSERVGPFGRIGHASLLAVLAGPRRATRRIEPELPLSAPSHYRRRCHRHVLRIGVWDVHWKSKTMILTSCVERIFDCEFAEERVGTSASIWSRPRARAIQGKRTAVFSTMQRSERMPVWRGLDLNTAFDRENKAYILSESHEPRQCSPLRVPTSHRLADGECRHFSTWHFHSMHYRGSKIQPRRAQAVIEFLRHNLRNSTNRHK